jgi:hypothetical protein
MNVLILQNILYKILLKLVKYGKYFYIKHLFNLFFLIKIK